MRRSGGGSLRLSVAAAVATTSATLCLAPAFLRGTWLLPTLTSVIVIGAACELARRRGASRGVVPLVGALALLAYLALRYARDPGYYGMIPSLDSLDLLGQLAVQGRESIARYAAPIGVSPGIELLSAAGVGLVALVVDTVAVTYRKAALAGLPLLVLYTVPTAVAPDGVHWMSFALAGAGFLALLLTESRERVGRWGRPMAHIAQRPNWTPTVETTPLAQVGRRVGVTALGLAVVVPALLPDLSSVGLGFGSGAFGSGGDGDNEVAVVNPILDLGQNLRRSEDRVVIVYRGAPTYLRLVGLDEFTGAQWRPSSLKVSRNENDVEDGLDRPPGLGPQVAATVNRYRIQVLDLEQTWLPLPYPARRVNDIDGTWLYDRDTFNVFGENSSTLRLQYRVSALDVAPTPAQLRAAPQAPGSLRRYLRLPAGMPLEVFSTAREVTGEAGTSYDQALALQSWLRSSDFSYSTEVAGTPADGTGANAISTFLRTRQGYCVQFASTMAVMARALGIPARVAVGFTAGKPDGSGGRAIGLHDAHAWPELYFEGVGWVAFEPTPGIRTGAPPPWAREDAGATPQPGATEAPTPETTGGGANIRVRERTDIPGFLPTPQGGTALEDTGAGFPVLPVVVPLVVLLLLAVPAVVRAGVRRRRWAGVHDPLDQARAAWAEFQDDLLDYGHRWQASDSPRAGVARVVRERLLPSEAATAAHRVADATERARYAPAMTEVGDLRAEVATVRRGLAEASGRWTRVRARLLPRSTRVVATAVSERVADGFDAIDRALAATGRIAAWRPGLRRS